MRTGHQITEYGIGRINLDDELEEHRKDMTLPQAQEWIRDVEAVGYSNFVIICRTISPWKISDTNF